SWIMEGGREEIKEVELEAPVILPENNDEEKVSAVMETVSEEPEEESEDKPKKRGRPKKNEE
ncbi:MAG: hypothetical protein AAB791_01385, partial [Patescibacteria group bacterium]